MYCELWYTKQTSMYTQIYSKHMHTHTHQTTPPTHHTHTSNSCAAPCAIILHHTHLITTSQRRGEWPCELLFSSWSQYLQEDVQYIHEFLYIKHNCRPNLLNLFSRCLESDSGGWAKRSEWLRGRRTPIQKSDSIQLQVWYSKQILSSAVHCHYIPSLSYQNTSRDKILALLRGSLGGTPAIPVGAGSSMPALSQVDVVSHESHHCCCLFTVQYSTVSLHAVHALYRLNWRESG